MVPTPVPIVPPALLAAIAFSVMIVSPVRIDSIGVLAPGVTASVGIALDARVPQALNASVVSARMVAVALAATTGIAMRPEAASIKPPARERS